jgi:hypothetical protein
VPLGKTRQRQIGAAEIVAGMGIIIGARRAQVDRRNHGPQGFAQGRGCLHGIERALKRCGSCGAEIGFEQHALLVIREAAIGGDIGEVEQRRAEAAIFPIDEPEPLPIVEKIAGEKIVMTEHDRKRKLGILHRIGEAGIIVELGFGTGAAFTQAIGIVADDVEHPEEGRGALDEPSHVTMAFVEQRHDAGDVSAQVVLAIGAAGDMAEDHDAGFGMDELGRQAGAVGGNAHGALAVAKDVVDGDIAAAAGHEFLIPIGDDIRGVAQAALQWFEHDLGLPAGQLLEAKFERQNGCHGWALRLIRTVDGAPASGAWRAGLTIGGAVLRRQQKPDGARIAGTINWKRSENAERLTQLCR